VNYHFPKTEATVSTTQADVYRFRWPDYCSWAIFTVCNETGEFSVQSDWGIFAYRWNTDSLGASYADLTEFLANTGPDYVMNKFCYTKQEDTRDVFDRTATMKGWEEQITEYMEHRRLFDEDRPTEKQATKKMIRMRERMEEFLDQADGGHPSCVDIALNDMDSKLWSFLGDEPYDTLKYRTATTVLICRDELLPRFFAHLKDHVVPQRRAAS
jgi:hypothetical protein